jgi:glycine/D-amino acid oxidase-like deaminating enzyme
MSAVDQRLQQSDVVHIVGQGLAGTVLALHLIAEGYRVHVHDDGYLTSSSVVAAGMWNPLSFVNLKVAARSPEMLECMGRVYPELERMLGISCYHPMPLVRIFPDAGSANIWEERAESPALRPFMDLESDCQISESFHTPHGFGHVRHSGWLDLRLLLDGAKSFIAKQGQYTEHSITREEIGQWLDQGEWVIQCTGWRLTGDDFGADLPLLPNKGQVYTLRIDGLDESYMTSFGRFTIPLGDGRFRVGSTYEHLPKDALPSSVAEEILVDVEEVLRRPFEVIDHQAGFRPTTIDRFPILGFHQRHKRLGVFTGFGSRGVIMVPYYMQQLLQHWIEGEELPFECDWKRFEARKKG